MTRVNERCAINRSTPNKHIAPLLTTLDMVIHSTRFDCFPFYYGSRNNKITVSVLITHRSKLCSLTGETSLAVSV